MREFDKDVKIQCLREKEDLFMKGPGIQTYLQMIAQLKQEAIAQNQRYLEVNSKELLTLVSPSHATMPTCCQAIYKMLLEGDAIIQSPRGTTGYGSYLTVRYDLENMENRARMFPDKKRGRPAKSEEEKIAARKARLKRSGDDLKVLIKNWLEGNGWSHVEYPNYIEARNNDQKWIINIEGIKRGRKQPLSLKVGEVLKYIEDATSLYSIMFNDSLTYRREWDEIPQAVKERLGLSVILADKQGNLEML